MTVAEAINEREWTCDQCGGHNRINRIICMVCGHDRTADRPVQDAILAGLKRDPEKPASPTPVAATRSPMGQRDVGTATMG